MNDNPILTIVNTVCTTLYNQVSAIPVFGSFIAPVVQSVCSLIASFLGGA